MKKPVLILGGLLVAALIAVALVERTPKGQDGTLAGGAPLPELTLTAILPLTGNFATVGVPKRQGFELAVQHVNAAGGIGGKRLQLEVLDSKGDPKDGLAALQRSLMQRNANAYYIDLTPVAAACLPVVDQNKVVTFLGTAHPTLPSQSEWAFRFYPSGQQEAEMLVDWLIARGSNRVFDLCTSDSYGTAFHEQLAELLQHTDCRLVGSDTYEITQPDLRASLAKFRASGAEVLVLVGYGLNYPAILQQCAELGIAPSRIVGNIGFIGNPEIARLPSALTENAAFAMPAFPAYVDAGTGDSLANRFISDYRANYGKPPSFMAAYAYDAIVVLADALQHALSYDGQSLRQQLLQTKGVKGVTGLIDVTETGDCRTHMIMATYRGGRVVPLEKP